ncbi:MAG: hypothetical protein MRY83_15340 [Flavobacteriales bacterium]|nr:hypothetical protein [Flavobacteriales bacterium]
MNKFSTILKKHLKYLDYKVFCAIIILILMQQVNDVAGQTDENHKQELFKPLKKEEKPKRYSDNFNRKQKQGTTPTNKTFGALREKRSPQGYSDHFHHEKPQKSSDYKDHFGKEPKLKSPTAKDAFKKEPLLKSGPFNDHFSKVPKVKRTDYSDAFNSEVKIKLPGSNDAFSRAPRQSFLNTNDAFKKPVKVSNVSEKTFKSSAQPKDMSASGLYASSHRSKLNLKDARGSSSFFGKQVKQKGLGIAENKFSAFSTVSSPNSYINSKQRKKMNFLATSNASSGFASEHKSYALNTNMSSKQRKKINLLASKSGSGGFASEHGNYRLNSIINAKQRKKINAFALDFGSNGFQSEQKGYSLNTHLNGKQRSKANMFAVSSSANYFSLYSSEHHSSEAIADAFTGNKKVKNPKRYVGQNIFSGLRFKKRPTHKKTKSNKDAFSLSFRDEEKIKRQNSNKTGQDKLFQNGVLPKR